MIPATLDLLHMHALYVYKLLCHNNLVVPKIHITVYFFAVISQWHLSPFRLLIVPCHFPHASTCLSLVRKCLCCCCSMLTRSFFSCANVFSHHLIPFIHVTGQQKLWGLVTFFSTDEEKNCIWSWQNIFLLPSYFSIERETRKLFSAFDFRGIKSGKISWGNLRPANRKRSLDGLTVGHFVGLFAAFRDTLQIIE